MVIGASSIMMYKLGMQIGDLLKGRRMWLRQVDFTQLLPKAMMSLGKSALPQDKKKKKKLAWQICIQ